MSRGQQSQVFSTGQGENKTYNSDANTSFADAQSDIGDYADSVAAYKAANPYVPGGQAETAENQQIADTADAGAQRAGEALQSQAVRTGQNASGDIAATKSIEEANDRSLMGEEAGATESRLAAGSSYGQSVVGDTGQTAGMEDKVAGQEGDLAQGALGEEEKAAQTPSFMDELGQGIIQAGDSFAGGFGQSAGKAAFPCWVAAEAFGGWYDPRTVKVRQWVFGPLAETWLGGKIARFYLRYGERAAALMRKSPAVRWVLTKVCEYALAKAGN
jgi:hypothetical protein